MAFCTNCGHELGAGRFCTQCGQPVAPRPTQPPAQQPAQQPTARFPLFADEVAPAPTPPPGPPAAPASRRPWIVIAVALLVVVGLVLVVLDLAGEEDTPAATDPASEPAPPSGEESPAATGDIARDSSVAVPATAPPNQDVAGNPTTYVGGHMLDGVPETCWRMAGDGTGAEITVTLPRETALTEVGMVNGYAKVAEDGRGRELDWYHGNRRVLAVEWEFDDGTTVAQDLADTTRMQTVDVDVRTTTVVLRLAAVSAPGTGPASRDYTAISDLALVAGH